MEHTGLLFLLTCQPTKSSNFSRSGVKVRAHLLRKNYSRNFSSIQSAPKSSFCILLLFPDCGPLDPPCHGNVSVPATTYGSNATFYCDPDRVLIGDETRMCQANGRWSGSLPCCEEVGMYSS